MKKKNSYWNYRVLKTINEDNAGQIYESYNIIEVYYDSSDKITGYTDIMFPFGETEKELKLDLSMMLKACRYPALTIEELNPKKRKSKKKK